eukprot:TRINITY_DN20530_c0_g1_i10.p1 TRINITY_DN20530_c0_g1~~TRINITY_DN20530_c0_g1_i10.p1  ORF type:complete len:579 (+),score=141.30 TRINITY_DN20530_c0_g1_i10:76-1812(+)
MSPAAHAAPPSQARRTMDALLFGMLLELPAAVRGYRSTLLGPAERLMPHELLPEELQDEVNRSTKVDFECRAGEKNWRIGWSVEKMCYCGKIRDELWCCRQFLHMPFCDQTVSPSEVYSGAPTDIAAACNGTEPSAVKKGANGECVNAQSELALPRDCCEQVDAMCQPEISRWLTIVQTEYNRYLDCGLDANAFEVSAEGEDLRVDEYAMAKFCHKRCSQELKAKRPLSLHQIEDIDKIEEKCRHMELRALATLQISASNLNALHAALAKCDEPDAESEKPAGDSKQEDDDDEAGQQHGTKPATTTVSTTRRSTTAAAAEAEVDHDATVDEELVSTTMASTSSQGQLPHPEESEGEVSDEEVCRTAGAVHRSRDMKEAGCFRSDTDQRVPDMCCDLMEQPCRRGIQPLMAQVRAQLHTLMGCGFSMKDVEASDSGVIVAVKNTTALCTEKCLDAFKVELNATKVDGIAEKCIGIVFQDVDRLLSMAFSLHTLQDAAGNCPGAGEVSSTENPTGGGGTQDEVAEAVKVASTTTQGEDEVAEAVKVASTTTQGEDEVAEAVKVGSCRGSQGCQYYSSGRG